MFSIWFSDFTVTCNAHLHVFVPSWYGALREKLWLTLIHLFVPAWYLSFRRKALVPPGQGVKWDRTRSGWEAPVWV